MPRVPTVLALGAILLAGLLVYLPGIDGPFLFDDTHNIVRNPLVQMDELTVAKAVDAMYSGTGEQPTRGLARLSFALNYYFSGERFQARAFKLTNIAIHLFNGLLVFALAHRLLSRRREGGGSVAQSGFDAPLVAALLATAIWVLHPLQLTSVLYVVQRMTSLAGTFVFAGLLVYVCGREALERGRAARGFVLMAAGLTGGSVLGLLAKENAVLLPFLAFVVERAFFGTDRLEVRHARQLRGFLAVFVGGPALVAVVAVIVAWPGIASEYEVYRDFTMGERVLTQPRVLGLYLGLFFAPALRRFSLHHDGLALSTGPLDPPSTLIAIAVLVAVTVAAVPALRRGRMWAFAALFFVVGHAMESSVIALELVYEHRNYVPSFALALATAYYVVHAARRASRPLRIVAVVSLALAGTLGVVTFSRAGIWASESRLARYMVEQHPDSYRAHAGLARMLAVEHATAHDLYMAYREVARTGPDAVFPLIRMRRVVAALQFQLASGRVTPAAAAPADAVDDATWRADMLYMDREYLGRVAASLNDEIEARLGRAVFNVETLAELDQVRYCLRRRADLCVGLLPEALAWTGYALEHSRMGDYARARVLALRADFVSMSGDANGALELLREAARVRPDDIGYRQQVVVQLAHMGRFDEAEALLAELSADDSRPGVSRRGWQEARRLVDEARARVARGEDPAPPPDREVDGPPPQAVDAAPARAIAGATANAEPPR